MSDSIRVMVIDDHGVLRAGLRALLEHEDGIDWVGDAALPEDALPALERLAPDIVVMDLEMPGMGGLDGTRRVLARRPETSVVVLSMHDGIEEVRSAFEAGASGYVVKTAADEELVRAIRQVAEGGRYLEPALGARLTKPAPDQPIDELSPREREVLRLLALGYTNQEIAERLIVSVRTVESHRAHVLTKLGAGTRAEMVQHALRAGLLEETEAVDETEAIDEDG